MLQKAISILITVLCVLAGNIIYAQTTQGKDFWLSFGQNGGNAANNPKLDLQVRIVASEKTEVSLTFNSLPKANRNITIPAAGIHTLSLSNDEKDAVYMTVNGSKLKKSLHITSDKPVSVYALNNYPFASDATNVLPTNVLGTEYFHISYNSYQADAMIFIATEDGTSVSYDFKGEKKSKKLDKGEVWYVTYKPDMTGTYITSDKPIAYFAAAKAVVIPNDAHKNGDNLFQQIPPVNSWGTRFLVPDIGIPEEYPQLVIVMASQDGTRFDQWGGGKIEPLDPILNKGEFVIFQVSRTGCFILSNKPVGVCAFLPSYGNPYNTDKLLGGPAEVWIPPMEQKEPSATIASFEGATSSINQHYAIVITPTTTCENTTVNGESTILPNSWRHNMQSQSSFSVYRLWDNLPCTFSNPAGLTALVVGLGPSESYYYLGGSAMHNLDLSFSVNDMDSQDILEKAICTGKIELKAEIRNSIHEDGFIEWFIDDEQVEEANDQLNWHTTLTHGTHKIRIVGKDASKKEHSLSTAFFVDTSFASITGPSEIITGTTTTLSPTGGGKWESSDNSVASVDNSGVVTGISEGKAEFTFTSDFGCSSVTGTVTVRKTMPIRAVNDTVVIDYSSKGGIGFDALGNDIFTCSMDQISIDTVAGSGLHYGSLTIEPSNGITYKADKGYGIDSVEYSISCEGNVSNAKIYFIIPKQRSKRYTACENAELSIGLYPITDVEYFWYDIMHIPGNPVNSTAENDIVITKDDREWQQYNVDVIYKGNRIDLIEVTAYLSDNCGSVDPSGCAVEGQLLFREDFGGSSVSDAIISPNPLPDGVTEYRFQQTDELKPEEYAIVKHISPNPPLEWQADFSDHTSPGDKHAGYMLLVNSSASVRKVYETRLTGLCSNMNQLYFSAWTVNIVPEESSDGGSLVLRFELSDDDGNILETYVTSDIPRDPLGKAKWRNYGMMFDSQGYSSLILKIYCHADEYTGNDFTVDDIELRICTPPATMENKPVDTVCLGAPYTLKASYTDSEGVFTDAGKGLAYRWEYSKDGMDWAAAGNEGTVAETSVQSVYTIDEVSENDAGFYRFVTGSPEAVDSPPCRIVSTVTALFVKRASQTPDLRILINPADEPHAVYLTNFIDTQDIVSIKWSNPHHSVPAFSDDETGELDANKFASPNVYTYKYMLTSKCGASSAKAYVFTSSKKLPVKNYKEIFVYREPELNRNIQLNQILGLEDDGKWSYPNDPMNIIYNNVKKSSAKYAGARIFNVQRAYEAAVRANAHSFDGDPDGKVFHFKFESAEGTVYEFSIIAK
jgi:hypothetical protein